MTAAVPAMYANGSGHVQYPGGVETAVLLVLLGAGQFWSTEQVRHRAEESCCVHRD